jgi:hypothetical protein
MSNAIHSLPAANAQHETQPSALAAKPQQPAAQTATPQDKVTISESAKLALAGNTKPAG